MQCSACLTCKEISIHVLRAEDDGDAAAVVRSVGGISIHVLRAEDDQ